jgi:hypothetical protein
VKSGRISGKEPHMMDMLHSKLLARERIVPSPRIISSYYDATTMVLCLQKTSFDEKNMGYQAMRTMPQMHTITPKEKTKIKPKRLLTGSRTCQRVLTGLNLWRVNILLEAKEHEC